MTIPGVLDIHALASLSGKPDATRAHFHALSREEQRQAILRLACSGMSAYGIAHASGLAVEQVPS